MDGRQGRIGGSNEPMSAQQAADYLGVSKGRYLEMRDAWGIKTYRNGREVMTRRRELDAYIERGGSTATVKHSKTPAQGT